MVRELRDGVFGSGRYRRIRPSEFEESYDDDQLVRGAFFDETMAEVPKPPLLTIEADALVLDAVRAMNDAHVGCICVTRQGRLVGVFTERDVMRRVVAARRDPSASTVGDVMTPEPKTLPEMASVAFALRLMAVEGIRHVPLTGDGGAPTAVVSVRDIVAWMVERFHESVLNVPAQPGYPSSAEGG